MSAIKAAKKAEEEYEEQIRKRNISIDRKSNIQSIVRQAKTAAESTTKSESVPSKQTDHDDTIECKEQVESAPARIQTAESSGGE